MKLSILTFHRACNYGAFLQAFALKSILSSMGNVVGFIDYWPESHSAAYRAFRKEMVTSPKMLLRESLMALCRIVKYYVFNRAVSKHLGVRGRVVFRRPSELDAQSFGCVIYGSDQIWWKGRLEGEGGFDDVYWGEHIKSTRKIAYAPSMGIMDVNEKDKEFIHSHLANFTYLSARENALAVLLENLSGREVPVVLDPVLLPPVSFWEQCCGKFPRGRYVLFYSLGDSGDLFERAKRESRSRRARLIVLRCGTGSWRDMGIRSLITSPFEFVSLFRNAEFVVTDSFHGTAFSLVFSRPFIAGGFGNNAERVKSLLYNIGIVDTVNIDYKLVQSRLEELRRESLQYLNTAISDE